MPELKKMNGSACRKLDKRLPGTGNSNSCGAGPDYQHHLDDSVDSDQQVVNEELSLQYLCWTANVSEGRGLAPDVMYMLSKYFPAPSNR